MHRFIRWLFWPEHNITKLPEIENIIIIILNLFPIFGVLFLDWKAIPILLLYYVEAVIGLIFQIFLLISQDRQSTPSYFPKYLRYCFGLFPACALLLLPLLLVILASGEEQVWQSILNMYFWVFILLFLGNQVITLIKSLRANTQNTKVKLDSSMAAIKIWVEPIIIVTLVLLIRSHGKYQLFLIAIILIKTFIDLRSFLRKQPEPVIYHSPTKLKN